MELEAIFHLPYSSYAHLLENGNLVIRLRTKKNDIKKVFCVVWERFNKQLEYHYELNLKLSDKLFDYYEIEFKPNFKRLAYMFLIKDTQGKELWFNSDGFFSDRPWYGAFEIPYLDEGNINYIPEWVKGSVFYQIFVDRFWNGDKGNDPQSISDWSDQNPKGDSFYGGDILGVTQRLEYLKDLGINVIYLSPILLSKTNHKYDVIDYFKIDPHFGTLEDLRNMVQKAHELGMRVIIDIALNHCSKEFFAFQDVITYGEKSKYKDWFKIKYFPVVVKPKPNYECFSFEPSMPKLNTSNEEVQEYLTNVVEYWIRETDIDGYRFDVAGEVDSRLWRRIRDRLTKLKKDIFLMGEIWHSAERWVEGDMFHSLTNYQFMGLVDRFFTYGNIDADTFTSGLAELYVRYRKNVFNSLINLVDSHDTPRILTKTFENIKKFKLIYLFLFTFPGIPMIYYGDEIGMTGGNDPDCRKPMRWDKIDSNKDIRDYVKKLIDIRKKIKAFTKGEFKNVVGDKLRNILFFEREYEGESYLVVFNNESKPNEVIIELQNYNRNKEKFYDILNDLELENREGTISIYLEEYQGAIIGL